MRFRLFSLLAFAGMMAILFTGQSCDSDELPEPAPPAFCDTIDATYLTTIKSIIDKSCGIAGCHLPGGNGPGIFSSYVGIEPYFTNDLFEQRVFFETDPILRMPPNDATPDAMLSQEEMDLLECWVDANYPEE